MLTSRGAEACRRSCRAFAEMTSQPWKAAGYQYHRHPKDHMNIGILHSGSHAQDRAESGSHGLGAP